MIWFFRFVFWENFFRIIITNNLRGGIRKTFSIFWNAILDAGASPKGVACLFSLRMPHNAILITVRCCISLGLSIFRHLAIRPIDPLIDVWMICVDNGRLVRHTIPTIVVMLSIWFILWWWLALSIERFGFISISGRCLIMNDTQN